MSVTAVSVAREARFVLTNLASNNNKFWNIRLLADGSCETHWGRVGEEGQRKLTSGGSEAFFESKCREKTSKGYRATKTLVNTAPDTAKAKNADRLAEIAAEQIITNSPETLKLVAHLARLNVHRILEATTLQYDESKGTFSTPLGIVTADGITEARTLLNALGELVYAKDWDNNSFLPQLNDYLMLVPQNIGRSRLEAQSLFPDIESVQKQTSILDSLEVSLNHVLTAAEDDAPAPLPTPKLFEARLDLEGDENVIERIRRKFRATQQAQHACAHLDVRRVYRVRLDAMERAFAADGAKVGNVKELWHGTRASNLLSILKSGFVIAPANAPHCTGRMFGNGVYFSDQSTKSLNYAYGYWDGKAEPNSYMFLCDVAMGRSHTPGQWDNACVRWLSALLGHDSTFAKAGVSGVQNNEMIVYRTGQIAPRYLVEFGN